MKDLAARSTEMRQVTPEGPTGNRCSSDWEREPSAPVAVAFGGWLPAHVRGGAGAVLRGANVRVGTQGARRPAPGVSRRRRPQRGVVLRRRLGDRIRRLRGS